MARHKLDPSYAGHLRHFIQEGYIVLDKFISKEWCDQVNGDLDSLIRSGVLHYNHPGQRVEKLFEHSSATRRLWAHPQILSLLSAIYDDVALPCQTLNFIHGSQQDVHQDLVHLTPFPAGMMCGVWIALEDVHPDSGPLVVYPRSHRLPRLYTRTVPVDKVRDGNWHPFVEKYSPRLMELIKHADLKPVYYTPKTGSVLIWHETLAHGGSQRKSDSITRKSMVSHYFARGGLAFYDSAGTPGWTHED
jgi:ectoine hydroxylase-related dioxygenase (phytanoyl-CoA dioxygenase family)